MTIWQLRVVASIAVMVTVHTAVSIPYLHTMYVIVAVLLFVVVFSKLANTK